jgi:hypothetical protein
MQVPATFVDIWRMRTPETVSGGGLNMGFCLPRAAAATVPRSPSWSYCFWISLTLRPVASASACSGVQSVGV